MARGFHRRQGLGKGVAAVVAAAFLLAACGGDDDGGSGGFGQAGQGGDGDLSAPSTRSPEQVAAASISSWDTCEVLGDHLNEFIEFLGHDGFHREPTHLNGDATAGVMRCWGNVIWSEDPEYSSLSVQGDVEFGFASANMEGEYAAPAEYETPTGRYDQVAQLRREVYGDDDSPLIEDTEIAGPWDAGTFIMGESVGTRLTALMVNTEHDFMVELAVGLGSSHDRHDLTWTVEQAKQQFLDVTVPNAYQAVLARAEETGR